MTVELVDVVLRWGVFVTSVGNSHIEDSVSAARAGHYLI